MDGQLLPSCLDFLRLVQLVVDHLTEFEGKFKKESLRRGAVGCCFRGEWSWSHRYLLVGMCYKAMCKSECAGRMW